MRRLVLVMAAVATVIVPSAVAIATLAPSAGAASGTTCATAKGTVSGAITFKKCSFMSGKDKANKSLSGSTSALAHGGTLTWAPSGQTTITGAPSFTSPGQGSCRRKTTEFIAHATVVGGTSPHTQLGDTLSARVCLKGTKFSLLKGSEANF